MGLRDDRDAQARMLFVEALAKIDTPEAARALAIAAVYDPVEEVRLTCLDHLQTKRRPEVVAYYVGKLRQEEHQRRHQPGGGRAGPDERPVGHRPADRRPGHDAQVQDRQARRRRGHEHQFRQRARRPAAPACRRAADRRYIYQHIPNQAVLDALVALTGQNFNFDKQAWKYWYAAQKKAPDKIDATGRKVAPLSQSRRKRKGGAGQRIGPKYGSGQLPHDSARRFSWGHSPPLQGCGSPCGSIEASRHHPISAESAKPWVACGRRQPPAPCRRHQRLLGYAVAIRPLQVGDRQDNRRCFRCPGCGSGVFSRNGMADFRGRLARASVKPPTIGPHSSSTSTRSGGETCIDTRPFSGTNRRIFSDIPFPNSGGTPAAWSPGFCRACSKRRFCSWRHNPKAGPGEPFPCEDLVEEVAQSLDSRCKEQAIETTIDIPANLVVAADRTLIRRAVEHLMLGGIAAMPDGGSLLATSAAGPNAVELEIADTGPTLSDEARRHAFDPSGHHRARRLGLGVGDGSPHCRTCTAAASRPPIVPKGASPSPCESHAEPPWRPPHNGSSFNRAYSQLRDLVPVDDARLAPDGVAAGRGRRRRPGLPRHAAGRSARYRSDARRADCATVNCR